MWQFSAVIFIILLYIHFKSILWLLNFLLLNIVLLVQPASVYKGKYAFFLKHKNSVF